MFFGQAKNIPDMPFHRFAIALALALVTAAARAAAQALLKAGR